MKTNCEKCMRLSLNRYAEAEDSGELVRTCAAFPDGIPADIWSGKTPHDSPIEGDGGVVFKEHRGGARY